MAAVHAADAASTTDPDLVGVKTPLEDLETKIKEFFPDEEGFVTEINYDKISITRPSSRREKTCAELSLDPYNNIIQLDLLSNCEIKGGGSTNLRKIIEISTYAKKFGFNMIKLTDVSRISFWIMDHGSVTIWLNELVPLQTGQTWYQKFGFTYPNLEKVKTKINKFINSNLMEVVHANLNLKELFIKYCKELIKYENSKKGKSLTVEDITESDISTFIEMYKGVTVSQFFSGLNEMLKENCPYDSTSKHPYTVGSCTEEYYWVIKRLSYLIAEFYRKMSIDTLLYTKIAVNDDHYFYLGKKNKISKQSQKKQIVKNKYKSKRITSKK
jgi:hypothetical protein